MRHTRTSSCLEDEGPWKGTLRAALRGAIFALALGCLLPGAMADDRLGDTRDQNAAYRARSQGAVKSLDSVIGAARAKGKVIDAQLRGSSYKLKVLDGDGRVRSVDVDASTASSSKSGSNGSSSSGSDSHGGRGGDENTSGRGRGRGR
jgi:hypothetical protein